MWFINHYEPLRDTIINHYSLLIVSWDYYSQHMESQKKTCSKPSTSCLFYQQKNGIFPPASSPFTAKPVKPRGHK